ncbi:MAG: helicase-related protein [Clostridiaceae bacterium]
MDQIQSLLNARGEYIKQIKNDLLGPGSEISIPDPEHELLSTSPDLRYSIGILFPRNNKLNADSNESSRVEESASEDSEDDEINDIQETDQGEKKTNANPGEENLDEEIALASQNMPSSLGITFFAKGNPKDVICNITFATYRAAKVDDCRFPFYPINPETYEVPIQISSHVLFDKDESTLKLTGSGLTNKLIRQFKEQNILEVDEFGLFPAMYKLTSQLNRGYIRVPHSVNVLLHFGEDDYIDNNERLDETYAKVTALRRKVGDNVFSISIMLVNNDGEKSNGARCIFQPEIRVKTDENQFTFQEYSGITDFSLMDEEEQSLELLYRNKKVYGTGMGTSLNWNIDSSGCGELFNDFFPEVEVPSMDFSLPITANIDPNALSMKYLSDLCVAPKAEKITHLRSVVNAYTSWIKFLSDQKFALPVKYISVAAKNIIECQASCERMNKGITALEKDPLKWSSFELANRAMYMQRVHFKLQEKTSDISRYPDDVELSDLLEKIDYHTADQIIQDAYSWRPFQLAFLLMSIESVTDETCRERDVVDLIWFPTGGGKTEAYLGLTALTIFYRRLNNLDTSSGTTVIMRYTLRLLAAQQFTRASTLICACEYIRCDSISKKPKYKVYPLGDEIISIGLWIGSDHTPNRNDKAKEHLSYLTNATISNLYEMKDLNNKFQVLKCPWCGTKLVKDAVDRHLIGTFGYRMRNNRHFELFCPQESCFFNERGKLPVQIVDEELYASPPTLLFGTVDKFAMLPWKKEIGSFFALNSKSRSPELIIQDELHLISGPLGTMVGLYETALDKLCISKNIKPKIVASTATIRRAKEQCSALYNRDVVQFPSPGIDAEDSFFAKESKINFNKNIFGRKYIGLMPSGKTKAMMEVRTIAALLQKIKGMDVSDEVKDKFWTLTIYFNSLKDLGKCSTLVDDDVKDFLKITAKRLGDARDARMIGRADELTSRVSTTELNATLDKLEKLTYSKDNIENKRYASNTLLATNMISVGIDVARLNVMLLVGQPKLTSEYIQASSRIGRLYPGVAFVQYDGSKSRDRSHYEQFKSYHDSFYKYVEPTGATPFSKPARDRALHAVVIAMLRHLIPDLSPDKCAGKFSRGAYSDKMLEIRDFIIDRNRSIMKKLDETLFDDSYDISIEIDNILEDWERLAENFDEDQFYYGEKFMFSPPKEMEGRLLKVFNSNQYDSGFDTMTSMRNVDAAVGSNVLIWEDTNES